jgi:hypothetical protein
LLERIERNLAELLETTTPGKVLGSRAGRNASANVSRAALALSNAIKALLEEEAGGPVSLPTKRGKKAEG